MIKERTVRCYCKEYWNIENYEIAVNDKTQTWECHHRLEISENKSMKQLKEEGRYYNVSADELIFLTHSEHYILHNKGKQLSEETKRKISETKKGKHHSAETRMKISEGNKGKQLSTETKQKMSESRTDKRPVICIETSEVFESLSDASRKYNLFSNNIRECCNGKRKTCGKLHWKWV